MNLGTDQIAALKTATHLLIHTVGGLDAAASVCRLAAARLSVCQSRNHPEAQLPIDVVLQLEAVAGEPIVTAAMARLQGLTVARPDAGVRADIGRAIGAVARTAGAAAAVYMEAQADGVVDAQEQDALRRHLEAVRDEAAASLSALGGGAKLRAVG